ncbi:hypothetical protein O0881_04285 [Janthinobacterium sp. SUN100]|uniref:hypothetical protein n=1 Tax=Janthinobacterium sp. SUN100 TaxID=3004101 RepID=UPI0025AF7E4E|nr:hypothetical protein [Janthinobacterium sp. SUN100]MDN2701215.1 hypothetical protein [Janthinobacterium sp. SUN100]
MERKRGTKVDPVAVPARRVLELESEVKRLRAKLVKADLIIDLKKNFHFAGAEHRRFAEQAELITVASSLTDEVCAACRALRPARSVLYPARTACNACHCPLRQLRRRLGTHRWRPSELELRFVLNGLNSTRFASCAPVTIHALLLDEGRCSDLGAHHVSLTASLRRRMRASQSTASSQVRKTETAGRGAHSSRELGHHEIEETVQGQVFPPVFHPGYIQPLCRWLNGDPTGKGSNGRVAHLRYRHQGAHRAGRAALACRPWQQHASQAGGHVAVRLQCRQLSERALFFPQQPVPGGTVKDLKIPAGLPGALWLVFTDARARCVQHFAWHNQQHRHSGIGMMTPDSVYTSRAVEINKQRQAQLADAFQRRLNRVKHRIPQP